MDELPTRIHFDETLRRCKAAGILNNECVTELKKLVSLRNPLTHFRNVDDERSLHRRSMATGRYTSDILSRDAWFAISLASRMDGQTAVPARRHSRLLSTGMSKPSNSMIYKWIKTA